MAHLAQPRLLIVLYDKGRKSTWLVQSAIPIFLVFQFTTPSI